MAKQQPPTRTPMTRNDGLYWLIWCLARHIGTMPPDAAILLTFGQWCLETGNGQSIVGYNPAGLKTSPLIGGIDYTFTPTRERLGIGPAAHWLKDPRVTELSRSVENGVTYVTMRVVPDHPACCFRWYPTPEAGFTDYVELLERRFGKAWAYLFSAGATPAGFARALKLQGYYTDSEAKYAAALASLWTAGNSLLIAYKASERGLAVEHPVHDDDAAHAALYADVRALLATTVLYGPERATLAWGPDA